MPAGRSDHFSDAHCQVTGAKGKRNADQERETRCGLRFIAGGQSGACDRWSSVPSLSPVSPRLARLQSVWRRSERMQQFPWRESPGSECELRTVPSRRKPPGCCENPRQALRRCYSSPARTQESPRRRPLPSRSRRHAHSYPKSRNLPAASRGMPWSRTSVIGIRWLGRVGCGGAVFEIRRRERQCLLNVLGL